ncbi:MAG TPA: hypothetical protein VK453_12825 [Micromonosporaceae bacterium]|nr:hypothetical protein [Micromonosporaceae bacterium]
MNPSTDVSAEAVLDLLAPFWQGLIGAFLVLTIAVAVVRLAQRGPSRMTTALLVTGGAIVAITVVGVLFGA